MIIFGKKSKKRPYGLTSSRERVLRAALALHRAGQEITAPAIHKGTGLPRMSVQRALNALCGSNYLARHGGGEQGGRSAVYKPLRTLEGALIIPAGERDERGVLICPPARAYGYGWGGGLAHDDGAMRSIFGGGRIRR